MFETGNAFSRCAYYKESYAVVTNSENVQVTGGDGFKTQGETTS